MAINKVSEAGKAFKYLNPDGEEDLYPPKTEYPEPEELMKLKLNPSPEPDQLVLHYKLAEPWFKSKTGSVIPSKRKLVKRMMFDQILQWFCSVSHSDTTNIPSSTSAGVSETTHKSDSIPPRRSLAAKGPKRRLVKRMMFDQILQWFCSVSLSDTTNIPSSTSAGVSETTHKSDSIPPRRSLAAKWPKFTPSL